VSGGSVARARRGHGSGSRGRNRVAVEAATAEAIVGGATSGSSGAYGRGWRRRAQPHWLEKEEKGGEGRQPTPPGAHVRRPQRDPSPVSNPNLNPISLSLLVVDLPLHFNAVTARWV